ncbi:hypothetical protein, partial [Serratia marcescens]|uniref:hypothetical protein n=1 Tax=Serratia marcescens TaxID=615 RepID=UPI0019552559
GGGVYGVFPKGRAANWKSKRLIQIFFFYNFGEGLLRCGRLCISAGVWWPRIIGKPWVQAVSSALTSVFTRRGAL